MLLEPNMPLLYKYFARFIAFIHVCIILINVVAIPCIIYFEPFWIWMPIITVMVSPVLGGTYCMFNRIENHYRIKAGLWPIQDRMTHLFGKEL